MSVLNVNSKNFNEEIKEGIVLVDFFANWCGPCKMLSPIVDQVSNEFSNVKFLKLNVDESSDIAGNYNIMSIPALLLFKDGVLISKSVGFISAEELKNFIVQSM